MGPDMMHGMMERMMRGTAEGLARGLVEGMAAVHGMEPEIGPSEGMGPRGMRQPGMMRGAAWGQRSFTARRPRGSVERARAMLEGVLAWHGNPRLKLARSKSRTTTPSSPRS